MSPRGPPSPIVASPDPIRSPSHTTVKPPNSLGKGLRQINTPVSTNKAPGWSRVPNISKLSRDEMEELVQRRAEAEALRMFQEQQAGKIKERGGILPGPTIASSDTVHSAPPPKVKSPLVSSMKAIVPVGQIKPRVTVDDATVEALAEKEARRMFSEMQQQQQQQLKLQRLQEEQKEEKVANDLRKEVPVLRRKLSAIEIEEEISKRADVEAKRMVEEMKQKRGQIEKTSSASSASLSSSTSSSLSSSLAVPLTATSNKHSTENGHDSLPMPIRRAGDINIEDEVRIRADLEAQRMFQEMKKEKELKQDRERRIEAAVQERVKLEAERWKHMQEGNHHTLSLFALSIWCN